MGSLAARYGIKPQPPDPFPVVVDDEGATRMIRCERLGIEEEFVGSYTAAWEHGRKLVERHLREHGPVKLERPSTTQELDDVFGGY